MEGPIVAVIEQQNVHGWIGIGAAGRLRAFVNGLAVQERWRYDW